MNSSVYLPEATRKYLTERLPRDPGKARARGRNRSSVLAAIVERYAILVRESLPAGLKLGSWVAILDALRIVRDEPPAASGAGVPTYLADRLAERGMLGLAGSVRGATRSVVLALIDVAELYWLSEAGEAEEVSESAVKALLGDLIAEESEK